MNFVDSIHLICCMTGHQVGDAGCRAAPETNCHAAFACRFIEFELLRSIEQSAQIEIADSGPNCGTRRDQSKVISCAVSDNIKAAKSLRQRIFVTYVSLKSPYAV